MTKYVITHEYDNGNSRYYIESDKSFDEISDLLPRTDEEASDEAEALFKQIGLRFDAFQDEFVNLEVYEEPLFKTVNLIMPEFSQDQLLQRLQDVARAAVSYVGAANYHEREVYAFGQIHRAWHQARMGELPAHFEDQA